MKAYKIICATTNEFFLNTVLLWWVSSRPPGHHLALSGGPTEDLVDWGLIRLKIY